MYKLGIRGTIKDRAPSCKGTEAVFKPGACNSYAPPSILVAPLPHTLEP